MQPIRLLTGVMTVGVWTMVSRVLGFVRDILIAAFLGAGPVAEAFLVAFALPNMFRRFFAEGAFNAAFVPMFSKRVEAAASEAADLAPGESDARDFANDAFSLMAVLLTVFTILAVVAMPWLVFAMAAGFVEDERFALAVQFGRIAFPYILFISLAALLSGVLNAVGRFAAAAAAPIVLNILFIGALWVGYMAGWPIGLTLAWTVPVAGMAQLALLWVAASRAGFRLSFGRPRLTPELKRLAVIAAPAALAGGVVQINMLVGRQVASFFDGAVAWLSWADRLYQLPLGVVGIAIGVVLLPTLSRRLRAEDAAGGQAAFSRAGEFALFLSLPAAAALIAVPVPMVSVLFQRGAFDTADTLATAAAVAVYGAGLPAFVLQKVLQPLYFAREDTRSPVRYALVALVVNAVLAVGLIPVAGYLAAAWGTTLAGWAMAFLLWRGSRTMGVEAVPDDRFRARMGPLILSTLGMVAVLLVVAALLGPAFAPDSAWRVPALAALVAAGGVSYGLFCLLTGAISRAELRAAVRR